MISLSSRADLSVVEGAPVHMPLWGALPDVRKAGGVPRGSRVLPRGRAFLRAGRCPSSRPNASRSGPSF